MNDWWKYENEQRFPMESELNSQIALSPKLITWSGLLTVDGERLAAWIATQPQIIIPPAPAISLMPAISLWFRAHSAEASQLWSQFEASTASVPASGST